MDTGQVLQPLPLLQDQTLAPVQTQTQTATATAPTAPATVDPSILAYYDSLTNNANTQLGRLPGQLQTGQSNIANAYNSQYNQLLGQKGLAQRNYNESTGANLNNFVTGQGDVMANTGQQTNALQRLLGNAGFGNSSAALEAVPYATGLVGANQARQLQNTYGNNQQSLDQGWGDYQNQWNTSSNDLQHQRDVQGNALQSSIDQNKASLLSQLANIASQRASALPGATYASAVAAAQPYQNQINQLGGQIDQLGNQYANPVIQAQPATYQPPQLSQYNLGPNPNISQGSAPALGSNLGFFTNMLLGGQQQQQQQQQNLAGQATLGA